MVKRFVDLIISRAPQACHRNRQILLAAFLLAWAGSAGHVYAQVSTTSLISVWEMDEASGNAVDSHGSNTLTETSGTIAATTGKINGARDFEATGDSEYFEIADNSGVSVGDTDWTISAWVYGETLTSNPVIASKGWSASPDANSEFVLFYSTTTSRFRMDMRGSSTTTSAIANNHGVAYAGNWYHVVAWHDSVNNVIGIAINAGTANTTAKTDGVNDGTASFIVGSSPSQSYYWDGLIDQMTIWRRVLTSGERTTLYNSGNGLAYASWGGGGIVPLLQRMQLNMSLYRPTAWDKFVSQTPISLLKE